MRSISLIAIALVIFVIAVEGQEQLSPHRNRIHQQRSEQRVNRGL